MRSTRRGGGVGGVDSVRGGRHAGAGGGWRGGRRPGGRLMRRRMVWVGLAVLAVSCASPPERTKVAELPVRDQWAAGAPAGTVPEGPWWEALGGTNLAALVEEALAHNHDLRQAAARVEAAVAQARAAGAALQPQLSFGGDAGRRQQVFVGLPIPGREGVPLVSRSTSYGASLNLSWELDLWGRIRAGQSAALADLQASEAAWRGARNSLAAQTARAWLALVAANHQCKLARATRDNLARTAERIEARYRQGLRPALDHRMALNNLAVAEGLVAAREREREAAIRQLEILLGRYPAGELDARAPLPEVGEEIPAGLPSDLLERRPDLVAAERQLAASLTRVKEAKRALLPRISLTASGGRTSNQLEDLLDSSFNMWTLAANLTQPLLQGGRLRANVRLARARAREALENYVSVVLRAFGEVETALVAEQKLREREAALAESVRHAREAWQLAEERYQAGLIDFVTLMETQRAVYTAESDWIQARRQRLDNRIDLYLALGGGFGSETAAEAENVASKD
ncbi:MAG: efflux transporter outer membrane subunit [Verrucomicrobia bacterium]|nr:MAG: efflux transporter outer membrane subunit [Verrucomicrobiota bacterium]